MKDQSSLRRGVVLALAALFTLGVVLLLVSASGRAVEEPPRTTAAPSVAEERAISAPRELLAAERFATDPSAETIRELFLSLGGFAGLEVAVAEGSFDLVRFDPANPDRLLAAVRSSYGDAENQHVTEMWTVSENGGVIQDLWAPNTEHDFAHFNVDGTTTTWIHGGGSGFAPRIAVVSGSSGAIKTAPMFASRFSTALGTVFALTGNGDYYTNELGYVDLIADRGDGPVTLAAGGDFDWIDNPHPEILVAFPASDLGTTAVWDVESLARIPDHRLNNQPYRRLAISGDRKAALAVTHDDTLELVDLNNGDVTMRFGQVDVVGVDRPITLSHDGSIAVTVEHRGRVSIWWTATGQLIAAIETREGQSRWVSERYSPTTTSVVSTSALRIALATDATIDSPAGWTIVDTDPESWIRRASVG